MKNIKNVLISVMTLVLSLGAYTSVFALEAGVSVDSSVSITRTSYDREAVSAKSSSSVGVKTENERESGTSSKWVADDKEVKASSTASTRKSSSSEADEHRSVVAKFVVNLLKVADRDAGGLGAEVRAVAFEQNDSSTSTSESIAKVEARSSLKTFLIGSDYRNLGAIRSELAKTDKRIERLQAAASSSASVSVKADIAAQIKLLQDDKVKVTAFVDAHEKAFSLFGWFVKIFVK